MFGRCSRAGSSTSCSSPSRRSSPAAAQRSGSPSPRGRAAPGRGRAGGAAVAPPVGRPSVPALRLLGGRACRRFRAEVARAAGPRRRRRDQAGGDRERERRVQARPERVRDQPGEEAVRCRARPRSPPTGGRGRAARSASAPGRTPRNAAKMHRDGRQVPDVRGGRGGNAVRLEPGRERVRQRRREPDDHQREEDPDREHLRRVLERLVHAGAGAAMLAPGGCSSRPRGSERRTRPWRAPSGR